MISQAECKVGNWEVAEKRGKVSESGGGGQNFEMSPN